MTILINMKDITFNDIIKCPPISAEPHSPITPIRKQYLEHLIKILSQNYIASCGKIPPHEIIFIAQDIEMYAAAHAMVVPLYRKAIVPMIKEIKGHTDCKQLYSNCLIKNFYDKACQTEQADEDYISIKENVSKCINKNVESKYANSNNIDKIQITCDDFEDEIFKEMKELFKNDNENINEENIFDEITKDRQIMLLMNEINNYDKKDKNTNQTMDVLHKNLEIPTSNCTFVSNNNNNNNSHDLLNDMQSIGSTFSEKKESINPKYTYSKWPCEGYYQKKLLQESLDEICESDMRLHTRIKKRFINLFGQCSDDEQNIQSPNHSDDFIRSCRQRITSWMVHRIKPYFAKRNIPSYLFRPLTKYLIYRLININQYPSDYDVFLFVKEYFKKHPRIQCQADFN